MNPETGKPLWQLDLKPQYAMSIARPQFADNLVYASGIGTASVLFELNGTQTKERWRGEAKTSLYASNSTPVFHNGVIYGSDCQLGALMAVDVKDGSRLWQSFQATQPEGRRVSHGTAFVSRDDDRFWLFSETGDLILAKLDREGYHEFGRSRVVAPTGEAFNRAVVWSHPAYANQCAYIRNDKEIVCVSLKPEDYATK